jgi:hypothetical protein
MHRHDQNGGVGDDIGYCVPDEDSSEVETCSGYGGIPSSRDGIALEDADEHEDQGPEDGDCADHVGGDLEASEGKYAAVYDEDGYLDHRDVDEIQGFECEEDLGLLVSTDVLNNRLIE